jgi:hypothetical protein
MVSPRDEPRFIALLQGSIQMTSSFSMILSPTECVEQSGETPAGAPYVLVAGIDMRAVWPDVEAVLYRPWKDARPAAPAGIVPLIWRDSFWRLDIVAAPIAKPDDLILLVTLVEHVDGNPCTMRTLVKEAVIDALDASTGMARKARIAKLLRSINGAVDFANGGPNFSSAIELRLTTDDAACLKSNSHCRFVVSFFGYGGEYCLALDLYNAEAGLNEVFALAAE